MGPEDDQDVVMYVPDDDYVSNLVNYQEYDQASVPDIDETPLTEDDYS